MPPPDMRDAYLRVGKHAQDVAKQPHVEVVGLLIEVLRGKHFPCGSQAHKLKP